MSRLRNVFAGLMKSLFPAKRQPNYMGADQHGNKYFEMLPDVKNNLRGSRYIEQPEGLFTDPFDPPKVPVEWEAWLRMKRQDPPTIEEIQRNYARMMQTKLRAQELEQGYKNKEIQSNDSALPITENITPESHQSQFPEYPGFETKPGQNKRRTE